MANIGWHGLGRPHATMTYDRQFFEKYEPIVESSARRIVPELLKLLSPRSVVDVGCGVGTWLAEFQRQGVADVVGIDANYIDRRMLKIDQSAFLARDLRQPLAVDRSFDLAICLEVAEHLPAARAEALVEDLVKLAPILLFSAAVPFQGGTEHLNEQWPRYWASIFARFGYLPLDCLRCRIWEDDQIAWWYRQNIILFARHDFIEKDPGLKKLAGQQSSTVLAFVHPKLYLWKVQMLDSPRGLRALLHELSHAVWRPFKDRLLTKRE